MTDSPLRIDFYILKRREASSRLQFTCRLNEKVFALQNRIFNLAASAAEAKKLDELMWTFRPGSFVPHEIHRGSIDDITAPIIIGHEAIDDLPADLLINLADDVPSCFDRFSRIAEIVDGTEASKRAGRSRYAFYRDSGYEPQTHDIG